MSLPPDSPDELPLLKRLRREVEGFLELELPEMAEESLADLPTSLACHPLMLDAALSIQMHRQEWGAAIATGLSGCAAAPGHASFFIHTAFCLHEMGRTEEAHLLLKSGPGALQREPLFHYNMGCYLTVLGRLEEAGKHLAEAFSKDDTLKEFAKSDRDLQAIWPGLP